VLHDLREIGPTYFFAPPRIWENILTSVMVRVEDAARPKRAMVHAFLRLAQDIERARLDHRPVPLWRRLLYPLGNLLVYGPLKDNLGLRRVRRAYTAGEAIGPEIFVFYRALGVNMKQIYGMTEASVFITVQRDGDIRLGTVGTPVTGVEIRLTEQGEVLFRSPGVFQGYYKNPDATRQTLEDGWVRTGDLARLDDEGFCYIIDRAKDMLIRGGENIYCIEVENCLYDHPAVMDAALVGIGHKTLGEEPAAVVTLKPGTEATEAELRAFVAERLAAFNQGREQELARLAEVETALGQLDGRVASFASQRGVRLDLVRARGLAVSVSTDAEALSRQVAERLAGLGSNHNSA